MFNIQISNVVLFDVRHSNEELQNDQNVECQMSNVKMIGMSNCLTFNIRRSKKLEVEVNIKYE